MLNYDLTALIAVADPDPPQISGDGGGGGSVTRQRDKGVPGLKRNFFIPSGLSLIYGGSPGPSPGSVTE